MYRKGNPSALLVGMQIGSVTVESCMEFPQKIKNGILFWPSDSISGNLSKETQNINLNKYMNPMFIAVLFTIAKIWKQSVHQWISR